MVASRPPSFDQPRNSASEMTATGIEGSLVYAASAPLRDAIAREGRATLHLDLLPDRSASFVADEVARRIGSGFLRPEIIRRETDHHQLIGIFPGKRFQFIVLTGIATITGRIDHQQQLTLIGLTKVYLLRRM